MMTFRLDASQARGIRSIEFRRNNVTSGSDPAGILAAK
jgi:hypothetical protein